MEKIMKIKNLMSVLLIMLFTLGFILSNDCLAEEKRDFRYWIKKSDGNHYQQKEFMKVDPKGDAFLMRKIDQVPLKLLKGILKLDKYQPAENKKSSHIPDLSNGFNKLKTKIMPDKIKIKDLDSMIQEIEDKDSSFERMSESEEIYNIDVLIRNEEKELNSKNKTSNLFDLKGLNTAVSKNGEFEIGKKHPFDVDRLINAVIKVIQKHPEIELKMSEEHKWSKEARRYMMYGFWHRLGRFISRRQKDIPAPLFMRSKVFLLLACGWTCRYAITGKEEILEKKLLSRPDRSLNIHEVFEISYVLHDGDMYLTMLAIENVLAKNPYVENRQDLPLQKKLIYLRNDSDTTGDNYGAWYHLFGISFYGMVRPGLVSRAVAEIESLGSIVLEGFDRQEDYINRLGAVFGLKLRRMIKKKDYLKPLPGGFRIDYMTNNEFKN